MDEWIKELSLPHASGEIEICLELLKRLHRDFRQYWLKSLYLDEDEDEREVSRDIFIGICDELEQKANSLLRYEKYFISEELKTYVLVLKQMSQFFYEYLQAAEVMI